MKKAQERHWLLLKLTSSLAQTDLKEQPFLLSTFSNVTFDVLYTQEGYIFNSWKWESETGYTPGATLSVHNFVSSLMPGKDE